MKRAIAGLCCVLAFPGLAGAAVVRSAADGFVIEHTYRITAPPAAAWQVLLHPERWWPSDHTWSGSAANLSLVAEAGGCFCERWSDGSAEHARVIHVRTNQLLRLDGALGPMQEMAVTGVLTVRLVPVDGGTEARVTYQVSGDASHQLAELAPVVDKVLGQQFGGFAALASRPAAP
jgi:uncharacterized protein YndB with AHSA1/START domain